MTRSFWQGKRVFVTGHTGFKGTWLCAWLLEAGAHVDGFALAAEPTSPFGASQLDRHMSSTIDDIRDREALAAALRRLTPDVVVHLAAQSLVRRSFDAPSETFAVNVLGTASVLDAIRPMTSVRAVVVVTSDKCYAPRDPARRHTEGDPLGGDDPYSASKACAELVVSSYRRAFGDHRIATARAGNVIGGGDRSEDRLVPDLLRAFEADAEARIRRPDDVRPWQHVLDPIAGYLRLAHALHDDPARFAQAWNFGPGPESEVAVRRVADAASACWGGGARWVVDPSTHLPERSALRLDSAKARAALGWRGRISLDDAIRWTVDWHKARRDGRAVIDLIREDIARFEASPS